MLHIDALNTQNVVELPLLKKRHKCLCSPFRLPKSFRSNTSFYSIGTFYNVVHISLLRYVNRSLHRETLKNLIRMVIADIIANQLRN